MKVGKNVELVIIKDTKYNIVTGEEMFRKIMNEAQVGDNVGLLFIWIDKEDIERGQVVCTPKKFYYYYQILFMS